MRLGHRTVYVIAAAVTAAVILLSALHPTRSGPAAEEAGQEDRQATTDAGRTAPGAAPVSATRTFFPVVRDGWRDEARFRWRVDDFFAEWRAVVRVVDRAGTVVEQRRLRRNPVRFTWDGTADGDPVAPGDYTAEVALDMQTPDPLTRRWVRQDLAFPVRVATKTVERLETTVIRPARHDAVAFDLHGRCFYRREVPGSLMVNCHPVGRLTATVTVPVPEGATVASYSHSGRRLCCAPGNVRETWTQPDDTLRLAIRVTGDRRYRLWALRVTFAFQDRA